MTCSVDVMDVNDVSPISAGVSLRFGEATVKCTLTVAAALKLDQQVASLLPYMIRIRLVYLNGYGDEFPVQRVAPRDNCTPKASTSPWGARRQDGRRNRRSTNMM